MTEGPAAGSGAIRAVICDFGGVLSKPLFEAFVSVNEASGVSLEELGRALGAINQGDEVAYFELERGALPAAEFLSRLEAALRAETGRDVSLHGFGERFFSHVEANDEMLDAMRGLRDRGYRMAILTNNVREWQPYWRERMGIDEIFEVVIDSGFVGMRKPERAIYELTLRELGVDAHECLFVDDLEVNCEAATELGMKAVRFESSEQALAEIEAALAGGPIPSVTSNQGK